MGGEPRVVVNFKIDGEVKELFLWRWGLQPYLDTYCGTFTTEERTKLKSLFGRDVFNGK